MVHFGIIIAIRTFLKKIIPIDIQRHEWLKQNGVNPKIWGEVFLQDEIERNERIFLPNDQLNNSKFLSRLQEDIIDCYILYGTTPNEYFMFDFQHKHNKRYRKSCLSVKTKDLICFALKDSRLALKQMTDKGLFYSLTGKYFKRDVVVLKEGSDKDRFQYFYSKHKSFIVKPLNGQCGIGTFLYKAKESADEAFQKLINITGGVIAEELIIQSSATAAFNDTSVNTVRLPSIYTSKGQTILQPFFRTGRKGQVVDNGGSGGIFAVIDVESGKLITDGYDELGHKYKQHPDSHLTYKGWQVPHWQELKKISHEIHRTLLPINKYIGFDFALTPNGWVLVEGNWGQFLGQYATGVGVYHEFKKLIKQL